jgi:hypothetical protein
MGKNVLGRRAKIDLGASAPRFEPLLDDPHVALRNAADDYMPYWAQVWAGSFVLANLLAKQSWPAGLKPVGWGEPHHAFA